MDNHYTPISCSLYDQIEAFATFHSTCDIVYNDGNNRMLLKSKILNLFSRDNVEYAELELKIIIRLDNLISINGISMKGSC